MTILANELERGAEETWEKKTKRIAAEISAWEAWLMERRRLRRLLMSGEKRRQRQREKRG